MIKDLFKKKKAKSLTPEELKEIMRDITLYNKVKLLEDLVKLGEYDLTDYLADFSQSGHIDCVKCLIKYKAVSKDYLKDNPIDMTAAMGHFEVVKLLIDNDLYTKDPNTLSWAANGGNLDLVKYLIEKGFIDDGAEVPALVRAKNNDEPYVAAYLEKLGFTLGPYVPGKFRSYERDYNLPDCNTTPVSLSGKPSTIVDEQPQVNDEFAGSSQF